MKPQDAPASLDEYIAGFPNDVRKILEDVRRTIRNTAPDLEEAIRYGIPTFQWNGKNVIHFAGYRNHIGLYPAPRASEEFRAELSAYKGGKGTIQFPLSDPIPHDLIRRIVEFRVRERMEGRRG